MGQDDTGRLLGAALEGSSGARDALLERLRPRIVLWAAANMSADLRAKVDPEDAAQDILLAVHSSLDTFQDRGPDALLKWVFTVARNRIRDLVDHHGALKRRLPEPRSFTQTSPSSAAVRTETIDRMRAAIAGLPPDYRQVIQLLRLENVPLADAALALERSEEAVRVLLCRALKALHKSLERDSEERTGGVSA